MLYKSIRVATYDDCEDHQCRENFIKPSAHSTIFVAEEEDLVTGDENLLCVGNTYQRFLSLTTIFNIKHASNEFCR